MAIIGGKPQIEIHTAGENLSARDYVFLAHPDAPYTYIDGIVPGRVYNATKLKRHCSINSQLLGFVVAAASAGATVQVRVSGNMAGFSGLVAGATYQPADTAGTIERLENHRAALPNPVATAISTTELCVERVPWAVRGKGYSCVGTSSVSFQYSSETVTAIASLTVSRSNLSGAQSSLKGYSHGGVTYSNVADALTFSNELEADVGDLTLARAYCKAGVSSTKQYCMSGESAVSTYSNVIDGGVFAAEGNFVDVCDLVGENSRGTAFSSATKAYYACGFGTGTNINTLQAVLFATEANASSVGTMPVAKRGLSAFCSRTYAYVLGGFATAGITSIDKAAFATETAATIAAVCSTATYDTVSFSNAIRGFNARGASFNFIDALILASDTCSLLGPITTGTASSGASS